VLLLIQKGLILKTVKKIIIGLEINNWMLYYFKDFRFNIFNRIVIYKAFLKLVLEYSLVVCWHKETYLLRLQQQENDIKNNVRCSRSTSTEILLFLCGLENKKYRQVRL
jgi:hypothetical protein